MRWLHTSVLALAASWLSPVQAAVHDSSFQPDYVLEATREVITVDCTERLSTIINGTFPGPPVHLKEGETTWIRVYNRMQDANLTIHWHGLSQRAAPFSDGTPLVSQWPIPPSHFFDYEIHPEVGDAGTYFYHSHVGFQQSTAHGALIVEDAGPIPYDYDEELLLMMGDFHVLDDDDTVALLLSDPWIWSGEPQSLLLNGQSGLNGTEVAKDKSCAPYIIDVEPDTTYRMRIVGRMALSLVKMVFEGHSEFTVIEADGEYTKPVSIDHIQAAPGQRYSFTFKTKSQAELEESGKYIYWARMESRDRPDQVNGNALLRYSGKGKIPSNLPKTPVEVPKATQNYLEYVLEPYSEKVRDNFPTRSEVTRTMKINMKLDISFFANASTKGGVEWLQNNETWKENVQASPGSAPILISYYDADEDNSPSHARALANGGFDNVTRTFTAVPGEVIEIVWENNSGASGTWDAHPMHVHGEHVYDLGGGDGSYNAAENDKYFEGTDFVPARRDTSMLHRYIEIGSPNSVRGWRAWRIRITEDNIGAWMMHCHISQHAIMGMNTVWMFGEMEDIRKKLGEPPYIEGYLNYGGSAYGNDDEDAPQAEVNEYFGQHA